MDDLKNIRNIEAAIPGDRMSAFFDALLAADGWSLATHTALRAFQDSDGGAGHAQLSFDKVGDNTTIRFTSFAPVECTVPPKPTPQDLISCISHDLNDLFGAIAEMNGEFNPKELEPIEARLLSVVNNAKAMWVSRKLAGGDVTSFGDLMRKIYGV